MCCGEMGFKDERVDSCALEEDVPFAYEQTLSLKGKVVMWQNSKSVDDIVGESIS